MVTTITVQPETDHSPSPSTSRTDGLRRQSDLYRRLEDGYVRIEQALDAGQDVGRWEQFWLQLLEEYERLSDALDEATS